MLTNTKNLGGYKNVRRHKNVGDTDVQFTADFIPRFVFELVGGSRGVPKQPFDK